MLAINDGTSKKNSMTRVNVFSLDAILGKKFPVLNDGFIRVVDYMGSDESIVQAARVSYGKGTKKVNQDTYLIRYLLRNRHTTPFEMCEIKLHIRVPMDAWRQWIRHRTANVNEYSTRYSEAINARQTTKPSEWRLQSTVNKQGSSEFLSEKDGEYFTKSETIFHKQAFEVYKNRIKFGIAREQARKDLPLSTYTEAYWKIDLHNLLHFLSLRMDSHAQKEIRDYATIIGDEIVSKWVPLTWGAFQDYVLQAEYLSSIEIEFINLLNSKTKKEALNFLRNKGLLKYRYVNDGGKEMVPVPNRELDNLKAKLESLGLTAPW